MDVDWARYCAFHDDDDDDDQDAAPAEHLRAFEGFIETVVPLDMALASEREQTARARRVERRPCRPRGGR